MTETEKTFLIDNLIRLLKINSNGVEEKNIKEYLEYVNKVNYSSAEINSLLQILISEKKIIRKGNFYVVGSAIN